MTASTVNDTNFNDFIVPPPDDGSLPVEFQITIPTGSLDDSGDRYNILSILSGRKLTRIDITYNSDGDSHATPTLDGDLVLSQEGVASGAGTETILYDAGTRWQSANSVPVAIDLDITLADTTDMKAVLRWKVGTAAATAAALTILGILWVRDA